jgi:ABC-type spermidine/putrescine transport system permease subunit II
LAFIVSLDNLIISSMLSDPGSTTLPVHIYSRLRLGITPAVNAVSSLMVLASALIAITSGLITRRQSCKETPVRALAVLLLTAVPGFAEGDLFI